MLANFLLSIKPPTKQMKEEPLYDLNSNQEIQVQQPQPTIQEQYPGENLVINVFNYAQSKVEEQRQQQQLIQADITSVLNLGAFLNSTKKQKEGNNIESLKEQICKLNHQVDEGKYRQQMLIESFQEQISKLKQELQNKEQLVKSLQEKIEENRCQNCQDLIKSGGEKKQINTRELSGKTEYQNHKMEKSLTKSSSGERQVLSDDEGIIVGKKGSSINNLGLIIKRIKVGKQVCKNPQESKLYFKSEKRITRKRQASSN